MIPGSLGLFEMICLLNDFSSKNRGGIQSAKFLSKLIEVAPCLVNVNAAYNLMPPESLAIICSALKDVQGMIKVMIKS